MLTLFQALSESEQQTIGGTKHSVKPAVAHGRTKADFIIMGSAQTVADANGASVSALPQQPMEIIDVSNIVFFSSMYYDAFNLCTGRPSARK